MEKGVGGNMNILFDITHPAHINFFKNIILKLNNEGHDVTIIGINRGKVMDILEREYPEYSIIKIGTHGRSAFEIYWNAGIVREFQLLRFLWNKNFDCYIGVVAHQVGLLGKIFRTKTIGVYDDPEHKINFRLSQLTLDRFFIPACLNINGKNIKPFDALKEWAYLSPKYFRPNPDILKKYGIKERAYIFIREVDTKSLNYLSQISSNIERLYNSGLNREKVMVSLENKERKCVYKDWLILEEPLEDIHSLMYYSKLVISNGDSMAREGAMLGIPSIYCGDRDMLANAYLINKNILLHITNINELKRKIEECLHEVRSDQAQKEIRTNLLEEWDDINEILFDAILN